MNDEELLHPDEALAIVLEAGRAAFRSAGDGAFERVALDEALGRHLPREILATVDQPPFDKSAMDGFAVGMALSDAARDPGLGTRVWNVEGTIAAGTAAEGPPGSGRLLRIMTGAPVPAGCGFVQRVEWTRPAGRADGAREGADAVVFLRAESGDNIIRRGENLRVGASLLGPRRLRAGDIGNLASSGFAEIEVARRPLVGIISTGDELKPAGERLGPASIHDSNGPQLAAQVVASGSLARFYGIVRDEETALREALARALAECDVVVLSGGVSMGDFDYVPRSLEALGVRRVFHRIAMKPGKPTWFGTRGSQAVFGLPGNPLSTFVNFEVFLGAHLSARMGVEAPPPLLSLPLGAALSRRGTDRMEFLPVRLGPRADGSTAVWPLQYHGSSMLSVLAEAEGLARLDIGVGLVPEGERIDVRLLRT